MISFLETKIPILLRVLDKNNKLNIRNTIRTETSSNISFSVQMAPRQNENDSKGEKYNFRIYFIYSEQVQPLKDSRSGPA